ncbi:hypothetical protein A2647_01850 [Candidatus Nomurabacteria bacterium RIFCSPHIGHO2_01_FULL_40_24b]|uniref:Uncharacterized protein n=2 Tax=Parcubacteria group TaxID=1794811 RepID=A0A1F6V9S8_9BACT|nr:MAG: hypothetical protein A2647_01850 [Candidatus Nomurabacteria bacterium RIFCSPHIGHO2_01_FULL_40_24b]OHA33053.1 MAG: hypothetical protein A2928_00705 [Candidatus Taylorbacteria bacterium RIFCSPLOWO2_01_FULL_45_15b]
MRNFFHSLTHPLFTVRNSVIIFGIGVSLVLLTYFFDIIAFWPISILWILPPTFIMSTTFALFPLFWSKLEAEVRWAKAMLLANLLLVVIVILDWYVFIPQFIDDLFFMY